MQVSFQAQYSGSESDSDEEIVKYKGVEGLIEIDNPNLNTLVYKEKTISSVRLGNGSLNSNFPRPKMKTDSTTSEKSEQTRADLARLAIVRKQREEASKKREKDLALKNEAAKIKAVNKSKGF